MAAQHLELSPPGVDLALVHRKMVLEALGLTR
jgi:hypothetical protein